LSTNLRVLALDVNVSYINPTRNLVQAVLKSAFDTCFFGPGYVGASTLKGGLERFVDSHGPFDFVVATEHIVFAQPWGKGHIPRGYLNNYVRSFSDSDLCHVFDIYEAFLRLGTTKCVFLFESDPHNFPLAQIQRLDEIGGFAVGLGDQFVRPVEELSFLNGEAFAKSANNNWWSFTQKNKGRIVSLPTFVSEVEFGWSPLEKRRVAWSVPGARYWARNEALRVLTRLGIPRTGRRLSLTLSVLEELGLRPLAHPLVSMAFRQQFQRVIESSKYSFTCGSGLGYPVRKFFEIPAVGAILVCMPCNGFRDLGFEHMVNAVTCLPLEIGQVHRFLEDNPEKAQAIADAGRDLVWRIHSVASRALQLEETFRSIRSGRFAGSYWENGDYCLTEENPDGRSVRRIRLHKDTPFE